MSAFIKLNKQDAYITTYNAYKSWHVSSSDFVDYNIEYYKAVSGSTNLTGVNNKLQEGKLYSTLKQLYYSGTTSDPSLPSSSFVDYQQTTIFSSMSRNLPEESMVIAIPQEIFGDAIRPGTLAVGTHEPIQEYVSGSYINTGYFKSGLPNGFNLYDDGEGVMRISGSGDVGGYVIYPHGIIHITDPQSITNLERYYAVSTIQNTVPSATGITGLLDQDNSAHTFDVSLQHTLYYADGTTFTVEDKTFQEIQDFFCDGEVVKLNGKGHYSSTNNSGVPKLGEQLKAYSSSGGTIAANTELLYKQPYVGGYSPALGTPTDYAWIRTDGNGIVVEVKYFAACSGTSTSSTQSNPSAAGCDTYLLSEDSYIDLNYFVDCTINEEGEVTEQQLTELGFSVRWNSTLPVYTRNYRCRVRSEQLNHTYNNSATTGSLEESVDWLQVPAFTDSTLHNNVSGSYFQPYVTTVGLYNDANELVAVGKLGQPTPKSKYTDMTFVVNLDI